MSDNKKTGLYIYELEELTGELKNEAIFPVSQDNLTRRISARVLRRFFNGDEDEPSQESYYSSNKVNELFENVTNTFSDVGNDLTNINNRIDELTNTVVNNYRTLDDRITREIEQLNDKLENWILYGSSVPTSETLPAGRLYIQYF